MDPVGSPDPKMWDPSHPYWCMLDAAQRACTITSECERNS